MQIDPTEIAVQKLHQFLLGSIAPRPIAFASTLDKKGKPNLSPFSFFNVFGVNPTTLIFSPSRRGRDNTTKHTYENAKNHPEVVINVVNHALLDQMVISSLEYDRGTNEFEKAGLTMLTSERVRPFRIAESPVQLECKVLETRALGTEGAAGNLVICEVVYIHVSEEILDKSGRISPQKIDLIGRLGGPWYSRAQGDALFEIKSNPMNLVLGYDRIPDFALKSDELTAKELSLLAQHDTLPNETEVNDFKLEELSAIFMEEQDDPSRLQKTLIACVKKTLSKKELKKAWMTLLAFNP